MAERSGVFDMIGPVMIGPSSSHTAGVVRIGRTVRRLLEGEPVRAEVTFYNSFARTFEGHGSDRAIVAGLMDFKTDDTRIRQALELAAQAGFAVSFKGIANASTMHPNTLKVVVADASGKSVEVVAESLGGGVINIAEINGFKAGFRASLHTLVLTAQDVPGSIAFIASVLAHDDCNIATMSVSRKGKHDIACLVIEMDSGLRPLTLDYLRSLTWVRSVTYIPDIDL
ncbi:MAG: L-serine ammonia-lyase, iron-sulfur-dependent subunit beta [Cyclobacteriaceae bacterium]|jgi:L-serine dehydratase|nr:L-serine ammonia-lyase, iron-sulfur-dependent subunit beta [Cyclobacteriaceae bacterium]